MVGGIQDSRVCYRQSASVIAAAVPAPFDVLLFSYDVTNGLWLQSLNLIHNIHQKSMNTMSHFFGDETDVLVLTHLKSIIKRLTKRLEKKAASSMEDIYSFSSSTSIILVLQVIRRKKSFLIYFFVFNNQIKVKFTCVV